MDELQRALLEIAVNVPELQRLVDEAAWYAVLPPEITEASEALLSAAADFNDRASEMRRLLLSQIEGHLPPPEEEPPMGLGEYPWPEPPSDPAGGATSGARRPIPPMPRSPGGERMPEEALEPARNP